MYWSATVGDHVVYESWLELSRLLLTNFDSRVTGIVAQPFLLSTWTEGKRRRHIPDYLLVTDDGSVVVDVKPRHRLEDPRVVLAFAWTRRAVQARGGTSYEDGDLAQTGRRTTRLDMTSFSVATERGRRDWPNTLLAIEQRVVLTQCRPGMIADDLSDYLFARSTGHIGSLMALINRGCQRAIRTGVEHLDIALLDHVKNDAAAEKGQRELRLAFETGKIRSQPRKNAA